MAGRPALEVLDDAGDRVQDGGRAARRLGVPLRAPAEDAGQDPADAALPARPAEDPAEDAVLAEDLLDDGGRGEARQLVEDVVDERGEGVLQGLLPPHYREERVFERLLQVPVDTLREAIDLDADLRDLDAEPA